MPVRLIVRRTPDRCTGQDHREPWSGPLFPVFDYHPMITDRTGDIVEVEADHRRHAEVELTIRDLKHDMGLAHFPTKSFGGNAAWLILNTIAHNLPAGPPGSAWQIAPVMTKKIRRRIYNVAGRLVRTGRRLVLHGDPRLAGGQLPCSAPWTASARFPPPPTDTSPARTTGSRRMEEAEADQGIGQDTAGGKET